MKKIIIITILITICLFIGVKAKALTIYQCVSGYGEPYTSKFYNWYYYDIDTASPSIDFTYLIQGCWEDDDYYAGLFKGKIGNSTTEAGHAELDVAGCEDGTCTLGIETETTFNSAVQGDLYFVAVWDVDNAVAFYDYFTGDNGRTEPPSDKWSVLYFWIGEGDREVASSAFGIDEEGVLETALSDKFPFAYIYDIKDMITSISSGTIESQTGFTEFSIIMPEISELGNSTVSFDIVSQSVLNDLAGANTWTTIRTWLTYSLWVGFLFWLWLKIKHLF